MGIPEAHVREAPGKAAVRASIETIGRVVKSELDLHKILEFVAAETARLVPYDRFVVTTVQSDGRQVIEFVEGLEVPDHVVGYKSDPLPDGVSLWPPGHAYLLRRSAGPRTRPEGVQSVGLQSMIIVPVGAPASPFAAIEVHSLSKNAYRLGDVRALALIADEIALAIKNARLYRDTARLAEVSAALASIGRSAAECVTLRSLFEAVHHQLKALIPFDRIVIGLWHPDLGAVTQAYVRGVEVLGIGEGSVLPVPSDMLLAGSRIDDFESEAAFNPVVERLRGVLTVTGLQSFARVEIRVGQNLVGQLSIRSRARNAYTRTDLELLGRVADQIAPAIEGIQLLEAARREAAEREAIAAIGVVATSALDMRQIFERVASEMAGLTSYDRLVFANVQPDGRIRLSYVTGVAMEGWEEGSVHDAPQLSIVRTDANSREALVGHGESEQMDAASRSAGLKSWLQVVLGEPEHPIGHINLRSRTKSAYSGRDVRLPRLVAAQVSPAVSNAQLYQETLDLADEARLLAEISGAATAGLDISSLAARFLEMVRDRVPFDRGVLRMVDAATGGLGAGGSVGVGAGLPLPSFRSRAVTEAVALGRLVVEVDAEPEEPFIEAPLARLGLRSSATLPSISDKHVVGVVTLRRTAATGFGQDELDFLSRACAQIAPAVYNARLLGEVSTLASTVENSPDFICSADLKSRVQYLNAAGREMVGVANDYDVTQFTWDDFFGEEDAGRVKEVAVPTALSRGSWHGEMRLKSRDGSTIPVDAIVVPVYHRNGALLGVTVSARDIADRKRAEAELNTVATTDTLTGLLNRRQFMLMLDQAMKLATRRRLQGTLVYLDLDAFKYVNDTHGHTAGDELLVAVGKTLKANVRASDVVARTGGDEFVIILHDASPEDGMKKANQLVGAVADTAVMVGGEKVSTTCSAGIVAFPVADASPDDLVAFADLAMYRAKDAGPNRTHSYDPSEGRRELVSGLQRSRRLILDALAANRVRLYRQPIIGVESREVAMYEVLVRMADFDGRLLSPAEFIPQAETLDVVHLIDQRVVALSFLRWRAYEDAGERLRLSINLSGRSLGADMAGYIVESGRRHQVEPSAIAFEITETATWRGGAQTQEFARLLNDGGYRMSIDDFGSGATSFKQIRNLKFHYLKLDYSLVNNLKEGRHHRDLVRSLSGLAHTLGVEVVVEYVRDEETMRFLQACGIEYAQGYYLGRPQEFEERPPGRQVTPAAVRLRRLRRLGLRPAGCLPGTSRSRAPGARSPAGHRLAWNRNPFPFAPRARPVQGS